MRPGASHLTPIHPCPGRAPGGETQVPLTFPVSNLLVRKAGQGSTDPEKESGLLQVNPEREHKPCHWVSRHAGSSHWLASTSGCHGLGSVPCTLISSAFM